MNSFSQITLGLSRISAVLRSRAWQLADDLGLSPTQAQILMLVSQRGAARVGEIAEQLAVSQPTASDAISALERKGQVERRRDETDARALLVLPTANGRQTADAIAAWPDSLLGAVHVLDEEERGSLLRMLQKMIRELQLRGQLPEQRICGTCAHFRPNAHPGSRAPHHCAFLDVPFGDSGLRTDCDDFEPSSEPLRQENWEAFVEQR